ncbi:MOSC N-terminal beta barrel domain-containing protein [Streptomyces sp. NPDC005438]|uniref:MOSC domain-containing protein n=1 Tax=Streptomyces sp. NPDC005438 TaxID=3156880 RepID=UPI0033B7A35D
MTTPRLAAVRVYPVKSLAGLSLHARTLRPWGLEGDRRWLVADRDGKQLTQRKLPRMALVTVQPYADGGLRLTAPDMEPLDVEVPRQDADTVVRVWDSKVDAVPASEESGSWLSRFLDTEAQLVFMDEPAHRRVMHSPYARPGETVSFADGFPLLLTTSASLDALNSLIADGPHAQDGPLQMDRFRPNIVIEGTEAWDEDHWTRIRVGQTVFRVVKPCGRCVITTVDQSSAHRGREPLFSLARHRRFGDQLVFGQNLIPERVGELTVGDPFEVLERSPS